MTNGGALQVSLRQQPVLFEGYRLGGGISTMVGATVLPATSSGVQAGQAPGVFSPSRGWSVNGLCPVICSGTLVILS